MSLADFMTETLDHHNNPTGAASPSLVASNQACTPLDPVSSAPSLDYPTDKVFLLRQTFTKYAAVGQGDTIKIDSVDYVVIAVKPWGEQGAMDAYYEIIAEQVV